MAAPLRARTRLACGIAGIDPLRLNEAVFAGTYACAPNTMPGRARIFGVDDIVALRVFADKLGEGFSPAAAGKLAELVFDKMLCNPEAKWVEITRFSGGGRIVVAGDSSVEERPLAFYRDAINVAEIRRFVVERIEEELAIAGDDD